MFNFFNSYQPVYKMQCAPIFVTTGIASVFSFFCYLFYTWMREQELYNHRRIREFHKEIRKMKESRAEDDEILLQIRMEMTRIHEELPYYIDEKIREMQQEEGFFFVDQAFPHFF